MEPRARAGKNVGKMNFGYGELTQLMYGSGDAREPLPETMRVLDEIATDFIQGLAFEAARVAHYAGRQKVKYEDFEFALRRNPLFLGKVREMFEMSKEMKEARKMPVMGEAGFAKGDLGELEKLAAAEDGAAAGGNANSGPSGGGGSGVGAAGGAGAGPASRPGSVAGGGGARSAVEDGSRAGGASGKGESSRKEEELGEQDDDLEAEMDALGVARR